jgi:hypothetical protein
MSATVTEPSRPSILDDFRDERTLEELKDYAETCRRSGRNLSEASRYLEGEICARREESAELALVIRDAVIDRDRDAVLDAMLERAAVEQEIAVLVRLRQEVELCAGRPERIDALIAKREAERHERARAAGDPAALVGTTAGEFYLSPDFALAQPRPWGSEQPRARTRPRRTRRIAREPGQFK